MRTEHRPIQYAPIRGFHQEAEALQTKRRAAIQALGRKWLAHPDNRVQRKAS